MVSSDFDLDGGGRGGSGGAGRDVVVGTGGGGRVGRVILCLDCLAPPPLSIRVSLRLSEACSSDLALSMLLSLNTSWVVVSLLVFITRLSR